MNRIKKFLKNNIKFIYGFILGVILTGTSTYAAILYASSDVSYDNLNSSGINSTNVQDAIDELAGTCGTVTFSIVYTKTNGTHLTFTYSVNARTTWKEFTDNYSYGDGNVFYYGTGNQLSFTPENLGEGYIRVQQNTSSTIVRKTEYIASRAYYVEEDDYCCFDPSTLITIDLAGNTKKIKDIEVGDQIVVESVKTGEKKITTVVKDASEHPKTYDITELTIDDGTKLKFNSYHPIYTTEGYKSITNYNGYPTLKEGDYVVDFNGKAKKIKKVYKYREIIPKMTYNLLIKGINEDFLEEEYAYYANGVLVHTGIAKYDDEDDYRDSHRVRCIHQDLYENFDYDKATDKEVIDFLVELYFKNADAEKEYIKYYINAEEYFRYTEFAREVKDKIKQYDTSTLNKYSKYNKKSLTESKQ